MAQGKTHIRTSGKSKNERNKFGNPRASDSCRDFKPTLSVRGAPNRLYLLAGDAERLRDADLERERLLERLGERLLDLDFDLERPPRRRDEDEDEPPRRSSRDEAPRERELERDRDRERERDGERRRLRRSRLLLESRRHL